MSLKPIIITITLISLSFSLRSKTTLKTKLKTKAASQTFVVETAYFESQCSSLETGFQFSLQLTTTSKYSATLNNKIPLISTNSSDNSEEINTYCYLQINSDEILCQTTEQPSVLLKGPFRIKELTSTLSFDCEDSDGDIKTCNLEAFDDESLIGFSLISSTLKEQDSPQLIDYQKTDIGTFHIDYEEYNGYAPIVYLNNKEVNCDEGNNKLVCYVDKNNFPVSRGNTIAYDVTILNDCGIVEDIALEVDIINKASSSYSNESSQAIILKVDVVFLFVLFMVLI